MTNAARGAKARSWTSVVVADTASTTSSTTRFASEPTVPRTPPRNTSTPRHASAMPAGGTSKRRSSASSRHSARPSRTHPTTSTDRTSASGEVRPTARATVSTVATTAPQSGWKPLVGVTRLKVMPWPSAMLRPITR